MASQAKMEEMTRVDRAMELMSDEEFQSGARQVMGYEEVCLGRKHTNWTKYLWHAAWQQARLDSSTDWSRSWQQAEMEYIDGRFW